MALGITTSKIDEVVVVHLSGAIYFGEELASLRLRVRNMMSDSRQIVLDLAAVTHLDSGGVGTLVGLFTTARKAGGDIKLAGLSGHPKEVLEITKLVTVFEIFANAEDAAASFKRTVSAS